VSAQKRKPYAPGQNGSVEKGLFRALLAGPGHSLADAFANLELAPGLKNLTRHPIRNLLNARVSLTPEEGEGHWDFTRIGDDMFVIILNFVYKDPRVEFVPGDGLIQFNFRLAGDLTLAVSRSEPLHIDRPSLLVWNQERGFDVREWIAPSARERSIVIALRPEYLKANFLAASADVPARLQPFVALNRGPLNYCQMSLSSTMFELAMKLLDNPYSGELALIYTEAVSLQLLCSAVHGFFGLSSAPTEQYSQRELKGLHNARHYLMQHLSTAPTIRDVARAAGMNETTLKRGFKAIFGETLFDFSIRCRMQRALSLLRDEKAPVSRVAEATGYRHQTSFATAFVRHFGMRPKDVRRRP